MRRKITFIISLILFQIFYLLSHYTVQYLNLFFLLTCLSGLLMQIFIGQKTEAELNLLKKQQALNAEHLQLVRQQENNLLQTQKQFTETLHTVRNLLHTSNCEKAEKLIHETLETFQRERFYPYCEDNLILAILESRRMLAEQAGIHVDYQIFLPEKSMIQPSDLSSVLFNILDNAIEACRSSEDLKKNLSLSLTTSKGFLSILVRNTKDPQIVFNHSTTKKDSVYHGLGLSIIEDICRKYDGSWQWNDCGDTFESVILLRYC